jgi:endoglucanase
VAGLKGYYYQRVSMPLEEKYAGKWHRSAGHPDTEVLIHPSAATKERPAGTKISSPVVGTMQEIIISTLSIQA